MFLGNMGIPASSCEVEVTDAVSACISTSCGARTGKVGPDVNVKTGGFANVVSAGSVGWVVSVCCRCSSAGCVGSGICRG